MILASASPRRSLLLSEAGLRFQIEPAGVDETLEAFAGPGGGPDPARVAEELARRKARAVAAGYRGRPVQVLGADTVVALGRGEDTCLLGKPEGPDEARGMLRRLSGSTHRVVTGVCAIDARSGAEHCAHECTQVTMRPIADAEVEAYVASGEWRDKAGGYAIQETADAFVTALSGGGFDNVVGLPVQLSLELLRRAGGDV